MSYHDSTIYDNSPSGLWKISFILEVEHGSAGVRFSSVQLKEIESYHYDLTRIEVIITKTLEHILYIYIYMYTVPELSKEVVKSIN